MSQQSGSGDSLSAFLLGGLVGVVVGLLWAPRTGKETRRRVQRWIDDLEITGQDFVEEGKQLIDEGKEIIQEKTGKIKRVLDTGRKLWGDAEETKN